jgi:hypothetical protein
LDRPAEHFASYTVVGLPEQSAMIPLLSHASLRLGEGATYLRGQATGLHFLMDMVLSLKALRAVQMLAARTRTRTRHLSLMSR